MEATVNYTFSLQDTHNFNILGGSSYERYYKDEIDANAKNMNSNDFFSFNYYDSSINTNTEIGDNIEPWKMMSYFGRINYNFKERRMPMLNALLIIFVIAKILGFITWSWWIVLSPLLIQVLIVLLSLISCIIAKFKIDKL